MAGNPDRLYKSRDGQTYRICEMTDDHLTNAMRYLRRKALAGKDEILKSSSPDTRRWLSAMPTDAFTRTVFNIYNDLEAEAKERWNKTPFDDEDKPSEPQSKVKMGLHRDMELLWGNFD